MLPNPVRLLLPATLLSACVLAQDDRVRHAVQDPATHAFAPGDVLVAPIAGEDPAVRAVLERHGLAVAERDRVSGVLRVRVPAGTEQRWARELGALREIAWAETNGLGEGGVTPNDTHYGRQWHLHNTGQTSGRPGADVRAESAWDVTTGSAAVVIAVLDTGIDTDHPEFLGRIDPDGYDFVNEDADPEADHPHGSEVTGCLCANADNGFGVAGMDWRCRVLPIKVLDRQNRGTVMDLAQGLNYAATQPDVLAVSMSLINYPPGPTLSAALQTARNAGKILLACAGNGGIGNADVSWPGASPLTISVGATDHSDARAAFSGTGAALDFVAPGENVVTVRHGSSLDEWSIVSGCSFATPVAAGIVGLCLARAAEVAVTPLDQEMVYAILRSGAVDQVGPASEDPPGRDDAYGHGRLDARRCLDAVSALQRCDVGNVGAGLGGPFDVLRINGLAVQNASRSVQVSVTMPFQLGIDAPPSNPQPSPVPPFFMLAVQFAAATAGQPVQLPLGIGELCFDPWNPTVLTVAGTAPWSATLPALGGPVTLGCQAAIVDTPQGHIAVTNAVDADVRFLPAPSISEVLPNAPPPATGVTVLGANFAAGLTLTIDGVAVPVLSTTPSQLQFTAPAVIGCDATLQVTNPDRQFATHPINASPAIQHLVPTGGTPAAGGTRLLILGSGFASGSTVTIGGNPMPILFLSETAIDGFLPPGMPGPAAVVVTTPRGCTALSSLTYTP